MLDPVFWALKLTHPTAIAAKSAPVNDETAPIWSIIQYEFPTRGKMPPVLLKWYDGGKQPPREITGFRRLPPNGTMLIGERAKAGNRSYQGRRCRSPVRFAPGMLVPDGGPRRKGNMTVSPRSG